MREGQAQGQALGREVRVQRKGLGAKAIRLALAGFLLGATGLVVAFVVRLSSAVPSLIASVMWGAPLLALAGWVNGLLRVRVGDTLSVEDGALVVRRGSRVRRVPLGELSDGGWSPLSGEVELRTRGGDVWTAKVSGAEEGQALLDAAGVSAARRAMRMRLGETLFLDLLVWLLGPIAVGPLTEALTGGAPVLRLATVHVAVVLMLALFVTVRQLVGPAEIVIGADGVLVAQRFRKRFVPFERIERVEASADRVDLCLVGGRVVRANARHLPAEQRELLQARVAEALRMRRREAEPAALAALDRGARSSAAWREAASALLSREGDYRAARPTREQVASALENPAAPLTRRLGAAMALAARGDADGRARVRIAAEASADAVVRAALERIAEGELEDAAIEEAIAAEAKRAAR
ncbi:MAG: hypothetical protein IT372_19960 [Polyangiaceae bacterium]|nr:hypothetical protein [Polyangiaceae bacterium]